MMKNIDWANLSFGYVRTDYNVRYYHRGGQWGEIEVCSGEYLNMHMATACLHYRQEASEGLEACHCLDGKIRVFGVNENATCLQSSCHGIAMPELPTERLEEVVRMVVRLNQVYIPPCESGVTLYTRPLLIGTLAQVGANATREYVFIVSVAPAGPYFKGGLSSNPYVIMCGYDRPTPLGTGKYKAGSNYAVPPCVHSIAYEEEYASELYLDAEEKEYINECGAANFFGIKNNTCVMPKSTDILPSIANKGLMQLAEDAGLKAEYHPTPGGELGAFKEAGVYRTATVINPINYIDDLDTGKRYDPGDEPGPISIKLYNKLRGAQYGMESDVHGWTTVVIK